MEYSEKIMGDTLSFTDTQYHNEYIAKWRGLTVATVEKLANGQYAITEWGTDQESTSSPCYANNLDAAWRHIKNYCRGDFEDELREKNGQSMGIHR